MRLVPHNAKQAFEAWKIADAAARELEQVVSAAWEAYFAGTGQAPTSDQLLEVSKARSRSQEKLYAAMLMLAAARDR
jgi:ferric-dicitrate binding protein FerR (iron transport regulator)